MTNSELIDYITENTHYTVSAALEPWFTTCTRFKDFAELYRDKIRSKIRKSQKDNKAKAEEKLKSIKLELEIAYLFLIDDRFEVEYEKYGNDKTRGQAPDFSVTFERSMEFNVEVRQIHPTDLENRFNKWLQEIVDRIRKVPSNLGFWINMNKQDISPVLVSELESAKEEVISFIENTIRAEENKLPFNTSREYPITNFEREIKLGISNLSLKAKSDRTAHLGETVPVFYKRKECKFSYIIFEKLRQMRPGMINVLIVGSNRDSIEPEHLGEAIKSINESLHLGDEHFFVKQKFQGTQDFLNHAIRLSGILLRCNWITIGEPNDYNLLWCNDQADQPMPEIIKEYLRRID